MGIVSERIMELIKSSGKSYRDVAAEVGVSHPTLMRYARAEDDKIPVDVVGELAKYFRVSPLWIMGLIETRQHTKAQLEAPVGTHRVPVLGRIACGQPVLADGNIDRYEYITMPGVDFILDAVGDSMTGAGIHNGDQVFIRAQEQVENGEIAAVVINGEATLKRVYYNGATVTLVPENDKYQPMAFKQGSADIYVAGKAVGIQRRL